MCSETGRSVGCKNEGGGDLADAYGGEPQLGRTKDLRVADFLGLGVAVAREMENTRMPFDKIVSRNEFARAKIS